MYALSLVKILKEELVPEIHPKTLNETHTSTFVKPSIVVRELSVRTAAKY
jgi:hypothetical protein